MMRVNAFCACASILAALCQIGQVSSFVPFGSFVPKQASAGAAGGRFRSTQLHSAVTVDSTVQNPPNWAYPFPRSKSILRKLMHVGSFVLILVLKPFKMFAWRMNVGILRGLILEITSRFDWLMIILNVQNNAMLLHQRAYGGNFLFGKAFAETSFVKTEKQITEPLNKCSRFMGVNIVSSDAGAFATNSGSLTQCPAIRKPVRKDLEDNVFTTQFLANDIDSVRKKTKAIVKDWSDLKKMGTMEEIRSVATRIFLCVLTGTTISAEDAHFSTMAYIRRFAELSVFSYYFPFFIGLFETHKNIRKDAYYLLMNKYGFSLPVIEMTLFAAMFSVGTLVIKCVDDIQTFKIDYKSLSYQQKRNFIHEAQRLWPTVTTVNKMVDKEETVKVASKDIKLTLGDEVIYPFICSNSDPVIFPEPQKMKLDRPKDQYDAILSWSKGPHACPAKEMSILVTITMLDALSERYELSKLKIFNPQF
jgi:Cytochrome P450